MITIQATQTTNNKSRIQQLSQDELFRMLQSEKLPGKKKRIRDELILRNRPLIAYFLNKYYKDVSIEDNDDILQEGIFGLMEAIDRYDPSKGFKFSTYATAWIRQSINASISKQDTIKIPDHVRNLSFKIAKERGPQDFVTFAKKKEETGEISPRSLENLLYAKDAKLLRPSPITDDGLQSLEKATNEIFFDSNSDDIKLREAFKASILSLSTREREVLFLRFNAIDKPSLNPERKNQGGNR